MKYLFDENVSPHLVDLLAKCQAPGDELQHVNRIGLRGEPDIKIIRRAIISNFTFVTGDRNDRTRGLTVEDMKSLGMRALFLGTFWDHMRLWDSVKWLVARWDRIEANAQSLSNGECVLIAKDGSLTAL